MQGVIGSVLCWLTDHYPIVGDFAIIVTNWFLNHPKTFMSSCALLCLTFHFVSTFMPCMKQACSHKYSGLHIQFLIHQCEYTTWFCFLADHSKSNVTFGLFLQNVFTFIASAFLLFTFIQVKIHQRIVCASSILIGQAPKLNNLEFYLPWLSNGLLKILIYSHANSKKIFISLLASWISWFEMLKFAMNILLSWWYSYANRPTLPRDTV